MANKFEQISFQIQKFVIRRMEGERKTLGSVRSEQLMMVSWGDEVNGDGDG